MSSGTMIFRTNLNCGNCVAKVRPHLEQLQGLRDWKVMTEAPEKWLWVDVDNVTPRQIADKVAAAGFKILDPIPDDKPAPPTPVPAAAEEPKTSYTPLFLIVGYLLLAVGLLEVSFGGFEWSRAMTHFMAGFFLVFSFFKMLNVRAFADSYAMYDLLAARSRPYALAYPFIELGLGIAYLSPVNPMIVNSVTLVLMLLGTAGVMNSLLNRRKIKCACLGTVFNLPMSSVTLIEDLGMAVMAGVMLVVGSH